MPYATKYILMDSNYRDRVRFPKPGHFIVPIEQATSRNTLTSNLQAVNAVCFGSLYKTLKWNSNAFSTYSNATPPNNGFYSDSTQGKQLDSVLSSDANGAANTSITIICGDDSDSNPFQFLDNYYRGAVFIYDHGGNEQTGYIESYKFLGNGQGRFTVSGLTGTLTAGTDIRIVDPTDIPNGDIFVPQGTSADNGYKEYIIFNDTRNEWRPVDYYDGVNKLLTPYTGPAQTNLGQDESDLSTWGPISGWNDQDMFSIRQLKAPVYSYPLVLYSTDAVNNNGNLWFEPGQTETFNSFNLGANVSYNPARILGSYVELTPDPTLSSINYVNVATGGTTTTVILTTAPQVSKNGVDSEILQNDFFKGQTIRFDDGTAANIGEVRTITSYDFSTKTITFAPELPSAVANNDKISIHLAATATVVSGDTLKQNIYGYNNTPLSQSNKIVKYENISGTLAAQGNAGDTSLTLLGAPASVNDQYKHLWISWTASDGTTTQPYARLITASSYDSTTRQTTVSFDRAIGSSITTGTTSASAGITITSGGTAYAPLVGVATTTNGDGVGLTVTINTVAAGAVTLFTIVTPGHFYKVGDVVTITGGGNNCTFTFTAAVLQNLAAGTAWYIHSGYCADSFNTPMNTQRFWIQPFDYDSAGNFTPAAGSACAQQQQVCYEIEVVSLVLPNQTVCGYQGGKIAFYPYVMVGLSSPNTTGGSQPHIIQSNNPNSINMQFVCDIDDVNNPDTTPFIKIDGNGMKQTVKFSPYSNLELTVKLPNGDIFDTCDVNDIPPNPPNPLSNLSIVFAITRVS
jgi:hypothetical protein